MAEELHDVQFETVYGPAYPGMIDAGPGRWFTHKNVSGEDLGIIWTDDADGLGFIPTPLGDSSQMAQARFRRSLANQGVSATDAFDAAVEYEEDYSEVVEVFSGDLSEIIEESAPQEEGLVAAAPQKGEIAESTSYGISVADDDITVLDLVKVDQDGVYVRESGAWISLDPEEDSDTDERVYGHIWYDVSSDAVEIFDAASPETELTKEDFSTLTLS